MNKWKDEDDEHLRRIILESTFPRSTIKVRMEDLKNELEKYANIGNIVAAVKHYKENETTLDIQLRIFKERKHE
jgi:hypothetical protein